MRWQYQRVDDTTPRLRRCSCGAHAKVVHEPATAISCPKCGETTAVETQPFFGAAARQREHEAWRAACAWNERMAR